MPTVKAIKAALDKAGIAYSATARKDDLLVLLGQASSPDTGEIKAPTPEPEPKPKPEPEPKPETEQVDPPAVNLPAVPAHMVRVRRDPAASGRDHRLIARAAYDADPDAYTLY